MAKKALKKRDRNIIIAILLIAINIIAIAKWGVLGRFLHNFLRFLVGEWSEIYQLPFILGALVYIFEPEKIVKKHRTLIIVLLFVILSLLFSLNARFQGVGLAAFNEWRSVALDVLADSNQFAYSGLIGAIIYMIFSFLLGYEGIIFMMLVLALIVIILRIDQDTIVKYQNWRKKLAEKKADKAKIREQKRLAKKSEKIKKERKIIESTPIREQKEPVRLKKSKSTFIDLDHEKPQESIAVIPDDQASVSMETAIAQQQSQATMKDVSEIKVNKYLYELPHVDLLESVKISKEASLANRKAAEDKETRLLEVLREFGIEAEPETIHIGPAVTKFEIIPDSSVKISKITSLQDNLMMQLAVKTLRIEAPIPGKRAVGIEIPNDKMVPVRMKEMLDECSMFGTKDDLEVILGRDLMGKPIIAALNKMPHLLVAGATGSGKSVCMNTIITSILLSKKPDEVKLLLIDPKKVEFTPYAKIPHLLSPVISDAKEAAIALNVLVQLMEQRYEDFAEYAVRDIKSYNQFVKKHPKENLEPMPWIVVIIDELADLMNVSGKEVELSIQRITQLARAAGIHLIVATQRPSVDVVTGVIKANIPSRIAFAVSSAVDSRTILDVAGAEKLLGYGDMLYIPMGEPAPIRVQGVYISDDEVFNITEFCANQEKPQFHEAFENLTVPSPEQAGLQIAMDDPIYEEAKEFVMREQKASTSLLQRSLGIGYNRAARIIDALEENNVIGPARGSKPREVYIKEND
ncbi:MAG TPA: DNA translocase FtsK [Erysipelothrix sp.]